MTKRHLKKIIGERLRNISKFAYSDAVPEGTLFLNIYTPLKNIEDELNKDVDDINWSYVKRKMIQLNAAVIDAIKQ